jgi:GrpB-like predicted nucleotidyltransferase (UPF0157 family)
VDYVTARQRLDGPIVLVDPDPRWPEQFGTLRDAIRRALGPRALAVEHVGSTSVPGLLAKPLVDVCLVVADPANEADYVPMLEGVGYVLRHREPDWFEHRLLRHDDPAANLHVFGPDCVEVQRMIRFRDLLRARPELREEYARTKQALAAGPWEYVQDYADAKSQIVEQILASED